MEWRAETIRSCCVCLRVVGYAQVNPRFMQLAQEGHVSWHYHWDLSGMERSIRRIQLTLIFRFLQLMQPKRDLVWPRLLRATALTAKASLDA